MNERKGIVELYGPLYGLNENERNELKLYGAFRYLLDFLHLLSQYEILK